MRGCVPFDDGESLGGMQVPFKGTFLDLGRRGAYPSSQSHNLFVINLSVRKLFGCYSKGGYEAFKILHNFFRCFESSIIRILPINPIRKSG